MTLIRGIEELALSKVEGTTPTPFLNVARARDLHSPTTRLRDETIVVANNLTPGPLGNPAVWPRLEKHAVIANDQVVHWSQIITETICSLAYMRVCCRPGRAMGM
jgi:hypothetical protein